ncbi:MAG: Ig-like domain-containing protein, partial [Mycobacterium sp.]
SAACTNSPATAGSLTVTAVYSGDANFATSSAPSVTVTVTKGLTAASLSSSANPSVAGQAVTYTATVTSGGPGSAPSGTVNFEDAGVSIAGCSSVSLVPAGSNGTAACTSTYAGTGSHPITAVYSGDINYLAATSATTTQTVNKSATATAVTSSIDPSVAGQSVTYSASVTATAPGTGTPTGTVTFDDGGAAIPSCTTVALTVGNGSCALSYASAGSHAITVVYNGDGNYSTSTSTALTQTVGSDATTTAVSSSANPSVTGQTVTYKASVSINPPGTGSPTGTVNFQDGGTSIGGCSAVALVSGQATCSAPAYTAAGAHAITAVYSGDSNNATSTGSLTQTVGMASSTTIVTSSGSP